MSEDAWSVLGAGSIGCLIAYQLTQHHIPCQLLLRNQEHVDTYYQAGGITLLDAVQPYAKRDAHQIQLMPPAFPPTENIAPITHLIVTTKAHHVEEAIKAFLFHIEPNAVIVLLQNGMGTAEKVAALLPSADIVVGTTTEGANRGAPFTIRHAGIGTTWLGRLPQASDKPIQLSPITVLKRAGFDVQWDPQVDKRLWIKLAINSAINGLTIIFDCCNGELLTNPKANAQFELLIAEITDFYQQCMPALAKDLKQVIYQVAKDTASNVCSSLQDWRKGIPTELDFINGYLLDYAKAQGIDLPINKKLMQTIKSKRYR